MNLDIRIPIGGMFSIIGLILAVYGLATSGSDMYARSLSLDVNLYWGFILIGFGGLMLFYGWRAHKKPASGPAAPPGDAPSPPQGH